jgi:uncharacterized membrane protein YdjX (TVP38/TMEM64 family)
MRTVSRLVLISLAALCVPLVPFAIIGELPGATWLSAHDDHALRFALTGTALLAADAALPIPSSIVGTMLAARLGFIAGLVCTVSGIMTGQIAAYALARNFRRARTELPRAPTLMIVFLSRPVPVLAEAVAIASGAAGLKWLPFLSAAGCGNLVYALALAANGAALVPKAPLGVGLVLPMLLPATAWLIWRRVRGTDPSGDTPSERSG